MFVARLVAVFGALGLCAASPVGVPPALHAAAVTCINPASGASWQISIDFDRKTVDANPARISGETIAWRDAKDGWNYTLNRESGELTVVIASSTGGYFLHDRCHIPP